MAENSMPHQQEPNAGRTRHGCLNCKGKKRKCDGKRPACGRCSSRGHDCKWGPRLVFLPQNALGITTGRSSALQNKRPGREPTRFRIQNITAEIIRDYQHSEATDASCHLDDQLAIADSPSMNDGQDTNDGQDPRPQESSVWQEGAASEDVAASFANVQHYEVHTKHSETEMGSLPVASSTPCDFESLWHSPVAIDLYGDSVFIPGSAYLDAHSTLRSHLIHEVRSTLPTRPGTPETCRDEQAWLTSSNLDKTTSRNLSLSALLDDPRPEGLHLSRSFVPQLSDEEECELWQNWTNEVAPWLDKFDIKRHFQHTLPVMARSVDHLRYSILAVSARQLERKQQSRHTERSLALYQMAIQLVLPQLHTRSTSVIASCVVLCVLEMLSSSPKAWRQHLEGCAYLIDAVGINGFSGGINQALFWCFARMDVCGGLIASMSPLIPIEHWASSLDIDAAITLFEGQDGFDAYACYAVYMCAQVLDLLGFRSHLTERVGASPSGIEESSSTYAARWTALWHNLDGWYRRRPAEMRPTFSIAPTTRPFPTVLYSNPAAISGNQLYHTSSMLMLQHKPSKIIVTPKPSSIFWHARQICGISASNCHHGAWTNAVQPLWIAGQWMSHESEQTAILELLAKIERETGWGTNWRAEDLKEFWGND
ncbi:C6 zinc finger domain protein [Boeremia exigua]|uniref:C6 zinc finger domain protein n=1 Tax=Boeremia exigua TaxID=749465 RepID=UPI001E8E51D3|nr:C6 zinc finger domain protein [Boeremia exigua]KAH6613004.1 C6 zinc finger domain protein [Boeremia exigua]